MEVEVLFAHVPSRFLRISRRPLRFGIRFGYLSCGVLLDCAMIPAHSRRRLWFLRMARGGNLLSGGGADHAGAFTGLAIEAIDGAAGPCCSWSVVWEAIPLKVE